jgi:hypothetical protein
MVATNFLVVRDTANAVCARDFQISRPSDASNKQEPSFTVV